MPTECRVPMCKNRSVHFFLWSTHARFQSKQSLDKRLLKVCRILVCILSTTLTYLTTMDNFGMSHTFNKRSNNGCHILSANVQTMVVHHFWLSHTFSKRSKNGCAPFLVVTYFQQTFKQWLCTIFGCHILSTNVQTMVVHHFWLSHTFSKRSNNGCAPFLVVTYFQQTFKQWLCTIFGCHILSANVQTMGSDNPIDRTFAESM
ncbi:hypothetical protein GQR58_020310 [Nymphon striatum]|nr:hypothetical protein GQR58_020310 [Nymphon striatum]